MLYKTYTVHDRMYRYYKKNPYAMHKLLGTRLSKSWLKILCT